MYTNFILQVLNIGVKITPLAQRASTTFKILQRRWETNPQFLVFMMSAITATSSYKGCCKRKLKPGKMSKESGERTNIGIYFWNERFTGTYRSEKRRNVIEISPIPGSNVLVSYPFQNFQEYRRQSPGQTQYHDYMIRVPCIAINISRPWIRHRMHYHVSHVSHTPLNHPCLRHIKRAFTSSVQL